MKRLTILLLLVFTSIAHAQEDAAPWRPDPSEIFADGVDVLSVEFEADEFQPVIDNRLRELRVWDSNIQEWQRIPYPDEFSQIRGVTKDGEQLILRVTETGTASDGMPLYALWIFNLVNRTFTRFESSCIDWNNDRSGGMVLNNMYSDAESILRTIHGRWVFYTDDRVGRTALCNTATGEMRGLLPQNVPNWWSTLETPDGEWIIIFGGEAEYRANGVRAQVYAYGMASGTSNYIGEMPIYEVFEYDQWISDTQVVLYSGLMPEWGNKDYFILDVTQPNSLQYVGSRMQYSEPPPRYTALFTHDRVVRYSDPMEHVPCILDIYDISTHESFSYTLGYECSGVTALPNGDYIYLSYASDNVSESSLMRLNPLTGERTELLTGEFEALISVSPSGRYAAVLSDDSGLVDRAAAGMMDFFNPTSMEHPQLELFDVETGVSILSRPATWQWLAEGWSWNRETFRFDHMTSVDTSDYTLTWISDGFFVLQYNDRAGSGGTEGMRQQLVRIEDDGVREQPVDRVVAVLPDQRHMFVDAQNGLSLYDAETSVVTPILRANEQELPYDVRLENIDANSAEFLVRYAACPNCHQYDLVVHSITYTIRLP